MKEGDILIFRIEGNTVVAEIESETDESLILHDPQQLVIMNRGNQVEVGLVPFIMGISDTKLLRVQKHHIVAFAEVNKDMHGLYIQATTGLQIAANGPIA